MTDIVDKATRSKMMAGIRGKDTKPEILVRRELHRRGFRYRLHGKKLPGSPDIVLPKWKTVVFVHGCYWHRHSSCKLSYPVKSNKEFWNNKFEANVKRDSNAYAALKEAGWRVIIIWECATRSIDRSELGRQISELVKGNIYFSEIGDTSSRSGE